MTLPDQEQAPCSGSFQDELLPVVENEIRLIKRLPSHINAAMQRESAFHASERARKAAFDEEPAQQLRAFQVREVQFQTDFRAMEKEMEKIEFNTFSNLLQSTILSMPPAPNNTTLDTKTRIAAGVRQLRKTILPPYTFDGFIELPVEIQTRIWSMAARSEEPKRLHFDKQDGHQSSLLKFDELNVPATLHVCQLSRQVALKFYTLFNAIYDKPCDQTIWGVPRAPITVRRCLYANTLYDEFVMTSTFIVNDDMDSVLERSPLRRHQRISPLRNIRKLEVCVQLFSETSSQIWIEFSQLQRLAITFPRRIGDRSYTYLSDWEVLHRPKRGTQYWDRAAWIHAYARHRLNQAAEILGQWKQPRISIRIHPLIDLKQDTEQDTEQDSEEDFEPYNDLLGDDDVDSVLETDSATEDEVEDNENACSDMEFRASNMELTDRKLNMQERRTVPEDIIAKWQNIQVWFAESGISDLPLEREYM